MKINKIVIETVSLFPFFLKRDWISTTIFCVIISKLYVYVISVENEK